MILILGGTAEARALASELAARQVPVMTSLAGRVANPGLPAGEVRIGGFGGPAALSDWLRDHEVSAVIDATHPFAERISNSAAIGCASAAVRLLRLERPGWSERADDRWTWVEDLDEAASAIRGRRAFITTGRQGLSAFATTDSWCLIRCVDPPAPPLPRHHELLLDRGPYTLDGELELIDRHGIEVVVTKDSGGEHTRAKLDAARARGRPVIIVQRPARPSADTVATVEEAVAWAVHSG